MALDKKYKSGTGDSRKNSGHTVQIRLEYNGKKSKFDGVWYVKTHKYEGSGEWVITRGGEINYNTNLSLLL